jgi:hypothetical protein
LRRQLADVGIARDRHRMRELTAMLPARMSRRPYDDLDADMVAEVLVYLVSRRLIEVPSAELAGLAMQWGERVCHFYRSDDDLATLLVPYFRQGLQDAERCVWLVRGSSEKARQAIAALGDSQYSPDQLEIDDAADWVDDEARWKREESRALAQGYHGLRVCGEGLHLNGGTEGLRIKALGTYRAGSVPVGDVARSYHAALVKQAGCWQRVPTAALNEA